jgi:hypothetical protein
MEGFIREVCYIFESKNLGSTLIETFTHSYMIIGESTAILENIDVDTFTDFQVFSLLELLNGVKSYSAFNYLSMCGK